MLARVIAACLLLSITSITASPCVVALQKAPYSKYRGSSTALFRFEEDGKTGFINSAGKVVIPPQFTPDIYPLPRNDFFEGLAAAQNSSGRWGFIDERGMWIVQPEYFWVDEFSEGLAGFSRPLVKGTYDFPKGYLDKAGREVIQLPKDALLSGQFSEGVAAVTLQGSLSIGKTGYIDKSGKVVIPFQFAAGGNFQEGLARVVLDGICYMSGRDGKPLSTPPSVPAASSCGGVPKGITIPCREGFIDKSGNLRFEFQRTQGFSEGLAGVAVEGKWGFIDPRGRIVIRPEFDEVEPFYEGLAAVRLGALWGYIDRRGKRVIPIQFQEASSFSNGLARVDSGYINKRGRLILAGWKDGSDFVQGLAHVSLGGNNYGYINKSGQIVLRYVSSDISPRR